MTATPRDTGFFTESLSSRDPELFGAMTQELGRQRHEIELIASENIVSRAVLEAQGSVLTNKYAEGYPGRRYYGGCEYVDVTEDLARERAKALFGAAFAWLFLNEPVTPTMIAAGLLILGSVAVSQRTPAK